jgi:hypothetical protein
MQRSGHHLPSDPQGRWLRVPLVSVHLALDNHALTGHVDCSCGKQPYQNVRHAVTAKRSYLRQQVWNTSVSRLCRRHPTLQRQL